MLNYSIIINYIKASHVKSIFLGDDNAVAALSFNKILYGSSN